MGQAAAKLCRLAFELAKAPDVASMAALALAGLAEHTQTDAGAVLLLPPNAQGEPRGEDLESIASRTLTRHRYHRLSDILATTVMREGEAVLARNVMGDSALGSRDSQGEILTTSVLCAPIRRGEQTFGLIHLYSTDPDRRARSRRPGVHPGRGRHRGRGPGEPQPPPGTGRQPDPGPHGKRATPRATGRPQRDHRPQRRHSAGGRRNRPGRRQQRHRADPRRERRGQGTGRPGHPLHQPAPRQRLRLPQLRRPLGRPAGQRVVRPRAGGVHRRHRAEDRQVRGRPPGHAHARRDRRDDARAAGQVPPRAGGTPLRARRRQQAASRSTCG